MFTGKSDYLLRKNYFFLTAYRCFLNIYFYVVRVKHAIDSFDCNYITTRNFIRLFVSRTIVSR